MNIALLQGMLAAGGKLVPILLSILSEIGPAISTLSPDFAQLVADANKTLLDFQTIMGKLATGIGQAAAVAAPPQTPPVA